MPSHKMNLHNDEEYTDIDSMASSTVVTRRPIRRVQFSPFSIKYCYDKELTTSLWNSPDEEEASKLRAKLDVYAYQAMASNNHQSTSQSQHAISPVGLEKSLISKEFTKQRVLTRQLVYAAVLEEQARLVYCTDEEVKQDLIAAASMYHSEWSRTHSEEIGKFQATAR